MEKKLIAIKKELKNGDNMVIADVVGCTHEQVSRVFAGTQPSDSPKGRKIIAAALRVIESRKALKAKPLSDEEYQEWLISKN